METTTDLNTWTEAQRVTGQGAGTPVPVFLTPEANVEARFWRVRRSVNPPVRGRSSGEWLG